MAAHRWRATLADGTEFGELQYVNDLECGHDPGPAEPVWSAD